MAFNPLLPATNSPMLSAEMRNQFNGLKDLIDENIPASEKGAADGVASLDGAGLLVEQVDWSRVANKPSPVADGTYTMGFGTLHNGTITVVDGIITAVQEAANLPPPDAVVSGAGNAGYNGGYYLAGTNDGKNYYTKDATHVIWWRNFSGGQWIMSPAVGNVAAAAYFQAGSEDEPWLVTWDIGTGPPPAPTVTEG